MKEQASSKWDQKQVEVLSSALADCQQRIRARNKRIEDLKHALADVIEEIWRQSSGTQNPFALELIEQARLTLQDKDPD